jgi:hypothetical protein
MLFRYAVLPLARRIRAAGIAASAPQYRYRRLDIANGELWAAGNVAGWGGNTPPTRQAENAKKITFS